MAPIAPKAPQLVNFRFRHNGSHHELFQCYGHPCFYRAEDILKIVGISGEGARGLTQYFADDCRQRTAYLSRADNFVFCVSDGDSFELIKGQKVERLFARNLVEVPENVKRADEIAKSGTLLHELVKRGYNIKSDAEAKAILTELIGIAEASSVAEHY